MGKQKELPSKKERVLNNKMIASSFESKLGTSLYISMEYAELGDMQTLINE